MRDVSRSLGIQKMPKGYVLLRHNDNTHYYLGFSNGDYLDMAYWDKWQVYRLAKKNYELNTEIKNAI